MAGLNVANAIISGRITGSTHEGRTKYEFIIDIPPETGPPEVGNRSREFTVSDIRSGCQGGSLQDGFECILSFLGASAESYRYRRGDWSQITEDDNATLFERELVEWAYQNSDEISMLELELTETPDLIEE